VLLQHLSALVSHRFLLPNVDIVQKYVSALASFLGQILSCEVACNFANSYPCHVGIVFLDRPCDHRPRRSVVHRVFIVDPGNALLTPLRTLLRPS
jgi:hypothetical protein